MQERKPSTNRTTLVDVAKASGFSASTVSIVLNEAALSRYVAAGTKERIRAVAVKARLSPRCVSALAAEPSEPYDRHHGVGHL